MKVLLKIADIIDTINKTMGKIFCWILLPMILLTAIEVFRRYVLNSPSIWGWELVTQIWGLMIMTCGGYCFWRGGFVRVDVLYNGFPKKVKYIINIVTCILLLICMYLTFRYGLNMFLVSLSRDERIGSVWGSPMWTLRGWVPLGALLMGIQGISELIKNIAALLGIRELVSNSDEIAEAIEQVKETSTIDIETNEEAKA